MRHNHLLLACLWILVGVLSAVDSRADEAAKGFHPELVAIELASNEVRPGDPISFTLKFRNTGSEVAPAEYRVFTHFEAPKKSCENIVVHADHVPAEPTTLWSPNQLVIDGAWKRAVGDWMSIAAAVPGHYSTNPPTSCGRPIRLNRDSDASCCKMPTGAWCGVLIGSMTSLRRRAACG
jgi:hypothetical protein